MSVQVLPRGVLVNKTSEGCGIISMANTTGSRGALDSENNAASEDGGNQVYGKSPDPT
jgi:hypothetical protein